MKISFNQFITHNNLIGRIVSNRFMLIRSYIKTKSNTFYRMSVEDYWVQSDQLYIILLRVRFKSTVLKMHLNDLVADQHLLKQLHPYDAYFLGVLSYMQQQHLMSDQLSADIEQIDTDNVESIPCVEFIGLDHISNQLIFKLIDYQNKIKLDIKNIYRDKTIIAAMTNKSAFDVGRVVSHYFMEGYLV